MGVWGGSSGKDRLRLARTGEATTIDGDVLMWDCAEVLIIPNLDRECPDPVEARNAVEALSGRRATQAHRNDPDAAQGDLTPVSATTATQAHRNDPDAAQGDLTPVSAAPRRLAG